MFRIILCALIALSATTMADADPKAPAEDVTYDRSGRVPLAFGKNKKGEDVICEFRARIGTNLKTWHCILLEDQTRAEAVTRLQLDMFSDVTNVVGGEVGQFGLR